MMDCIESNTKSLASIDKQSLVQNHYNNDINLVMYPFCSTSKMKRTEPIKFKSEDGSRWLEVTANNTYGMAKVWDFDILRFVLSKINEIAKIKNTYYKSISFSVYECLNFLKKNPRSGKNIKWFREAIDRLASTTYKGNIFRDEKSYVSSFTLMSYEYQEDSNGNDRVVIKLDERLYESIKNNKNLLSFDNSLLRIEAGIKKRIFEIVETNIRKNDGIWLIEIQSLQKLCANNRPLSKFKFELSTYREYRDLPWEIEFEKKSLKLFVKFTLKKNINSAEADV